MHMYEKMTLCRHHHFCGNILDAVLPP
uniref:Uncharacterized protein n=1 Tax=Rhizophora mucronata TaxID=61149 RepID=A0A2P2NN62_RHIMU